MITMNKILALALLTIGISSCGTVPITGRSQLSLVSDTEVLTMSQKQYHDFVSTAHRQGIVVRNARVEEVSRRLISAADAFLRQNKLNDLLSTMRWEVNTINNRQVNAFCMPGGKIVVYTGLLRLIGNGSTADAELAAVVGHEIAHALARHSNERLTNAMLRNLGGQVLGSLIGTKSATLQAIIGQAYGIGSEVFVALPFGRKQEYEADKMGLVLMALAGYDPNAAVGLWTKMARSSGGGDRNEFLSTHPSEANRIKEIQAYMPEALKYYRPAQGFSLQPVAPRRTKRK